MWVSNMRKMIGTTVSELGSDEVGERRALPSSEVGSSAVPLLVTGVSSNKSVDVADLVRGISAAATAVWRLQNRVERVRQERAFDPPKWLMRHLESARDALSAVGIEANYHFEQA